MIRLGLCCIFREAPIKFRRTTATYLLSLPDAARADHLAGICMHNADALQRSLAFCAAAGIGAFRINSQILPVATHPEAGYALDDLPGGRGIVQRFEACGAYARANHIRTSFHPDQFLVLSSPHKEVVRRSVADLEYHARLAGWVGADVITVHGGGGYGDKAAALDRLVDTVQGLDGEIRRRLTLENDDRVYTPADLLPVCRETGIPFVYDVHHHRCLPDGRSLRHTTEAALSTWNREPLFHLSSPLNGWRREPCGPHHDFIDPADFPESWKGLDLTVEVEAKAKELAVLRLKSDLARMEDQGHPPG
ncbi:MAG TPA: UV DNA damage repair endonuclease UvsE [Desulfosarcina sp.]|nr:UV DNA damage repair endonuclease UvsE [Desulfosarcina sp.]